MSNYCVQRALISVSDKTNLKELCEFLHSIKCEIIGTSSTCKAILEYGIPCTTAESLTQFPEMLGGRVKTLHPNIFGSILGRPNLPSDKQDMEKFNLEPFDLVVCNLYPFQRQAQADDVYKQVHKEAESGPDKVRESNLVKSQIGQICFPNAEGQAQADDVYKQVHKEAESGPDKVRESNLVDFIDIGGVSLLRASAKNYETVNILCDVQDYSSFIEYLKKNELKSTLELRQTLALKAFKETACYDECIASALTNSFQNNVTVGRALGPIRQLNIENINKFPNSINLNLTKMQDLRYGENPHQKAAFYKFSDLNSQELCSLSQLNCFHGKELSYNNMLDIEHAVRLAREFVTLTHHAAIIVKHNTPCGVGLSKLSIAQAYSRAFECDPISPFGGIVCSTAKVTSDLALLLAETFLEVVIAPEFDPLSLEILQKKKNIRLVTIPMQSPLANKLVFTNVQGGFLLQSADELVIDINKVTIPTKIKPNQNILNSMQFGMTVVKHARSNAIAIANEVQTLSIAGGFTNRVDAVQKAIHSCKKSFENAILASDAFFPFPDSIELIHKAGICYIIQPGGSVQDSQVIEACDKYGIGMVFTGMRHFKH